MSLNKDEVRKARNRRKHTAKTLNPVYKMKQNARRAKNRADKELTDDSTQSQETLS